MEKQKQDTRKPSPVPNGHDQRGKERAKETVPHSKPMAPDGISGYWE